MNDTLRQRVLEHRLFPLGCEAALMDGHTVVGLRVPLTLLRAAINPVSNTIEIEIDRPIRLRVPGPDPIDALGIFYDDELLWRVLVRAVADDVVNYDPTITWNQA